MGERKNKSSLDRIERRILCNLLLIVAAYAFGVCLGVSMDKQIEGVQIWNRQML